MQRHPPLLLLVGWGLFGKQAAAADGGTLYVSSLTGSDQNNGSSAATALASLPVALSKAKTTKASALLMDGIFYLDDVITLNGQLSNFRLDKWPGRPALKQNTTTDAKQHEGTHATRDPPVISGGQLLPSASWTKSTTEPGVWEFNVAGALSAALDGGASIYVNGVKREVVRTPTLKWNTTLGPKGSAENDQGFVFATGDISSSWSLEPTSIARWRVAAFHSCTVTVYAFELEVAKDSWT
jgi:hypothetical protein